VHRDISNGENNTWGPIWRAFNEKFPDTHKKGSLNAKILKLRKDEDERLLNAEEAFETELKANREALFEEN